MSSDAQITLGCAVAVWIFTAGGFVWWTRTSIAALNRELRQFRQEIARDINGIGAKVRQEQERTARRHQNISLAIVHAAPPQKEKEICELLKENC